MPRSGFYAHDFGIDGVFRNMRFYGNRRGEFCSRPAVKQDMGPPVRRGQISDSGNPLVLFLMKVSFDVSGRTQAAAYRRRMTGSAAVSLRYCSGWSAGFRRRVILTGGEGRPGYRPAGIAGAADLNRSLGRGMARRSGAEISAGTGFRRSDTAFRVRTVRLPRKMSRSGAENQAVSRRL